MKIYEVLIEYAASSLDRPFSYIYRGEKIPREYCRVLVMFNNRLIGGVITGIVDTEEDETDYKKRTGFELKEIAEIIDETPLLNRELIGLSEEVASYYFSPRICVFFAMLPPSMKPSLRAGKQPKIAYENFVEAKEGASYDQLTTRQAELLYRIQTEGKLKKSQCSPALIKSLAEKGKIEIVQIEKNRMTEEKILRTDPLVLNEEQQAAYEAILSDSKDIFLLEGVTGSGKTEVYLHLAKTVIESGKKVLMLVPEISLSYAMVRRFRTRFDKVAVLHSELTAGQRYDEYRRIARGEVDIVVGARSAVFAPLENIGLMIIDEEHSETYKQEDQMPYYNAIEVAKMRQKYHRFRLVLGSATPSLESKSRALKGVYRQLYLTKRIQNLSLPHVRIVDMSDYRNIDRVSTLISLPLREAIAKRIDTKEQTILLVNRRGYSPYVSCRRCGHVVRCPDCQVALTYHYETQKLSCHHCGYEEPMISSCPKCGSPKVLKSGFGTEKVELAIRELFPNARVLRLDSDVSKKRNETGRVLSAFENHEADILIGTQIVAKGHDFPCVTLVGVVLADVGLAIPSFRASERTFDLITQAIGRSGRNRQGEALVQTYSADHYVIRNAAAQDYASFYSKEIRYRKMLQNPPYTYMTILVVSGNKEEDVIDSIYEVHHYLQIHLEGMVGVSLIGPSEMFIKKYLNQYRRKLLIKYKDFSLIRPLLTDLRLFFMKNGSLSLTINVDPYEDY